MTEIKCAQPAQMEPIGHEEALRLWHEAKDAHRRESSFEWFAAGLLLGHRRVSAEVARLNEWADSFTDAHLKERQTGDALVKEVRAENTALKAENNALRAGHAIPAIRLTRDTYGVCVVSLCIGGREVPVIRDNGDFISHYVEPSGIDAAIAKTTGAQA